MDNYDHLKPYLVVPYANHNTAVVYKTIVDILEEYGASWFGCQADDWWDIALFSKFQYHKARQLLEEGNMLWTRKGSMRGSSERMTWHTTKRGVDEPREGYNGILWRNIVAGMGRNTG